MAGDTEHKRGYRTIFRSISQVFSANIKHHHQSHTHSRTHSRSHSDTQSNNSYGNNNQNNNQNNNNSSSHSNGNISISISRSPTPNVKVNGSLEGCCECEDNSKALELELRARSMQELNVAVENRLRRQTIVPVTDILRAQQIEEDNEVQQTQQTTILQRFKSASIGNLVDLPGEDDKKSIKNRMRMKFAVTSNVFRLKSEKKSRSRRSQVNSLCLDEQSKYPLFGARLNALELNMSDHPYVPRFVVDVCAHIERPDAIEQDGLYRASGNKLLVDELKRKLTHLYDPRWLHTDDIHTLTSLHKQFFRELPAPLITQEAYERLGRLTDEAAIERMRHAFDEMPEPNRSTLRFLIKHLTNVAASSGANRMPASNLAIVWGPCLLAANDINFDIGRMNMLAKVLIENYERIFRPDNERLVC